MNDIVKIESISRLHEMLGYPKPEHPLISVMDLSEIKKNDEFSDVKIVSSYYSIYLKSACPGLKYGRGYYDFDEGALVAMAPEQVMGLERNEDETDDELNITGWALHFHPDLIRPYPLAKKMRKFGFFSYESNEALHLSDKEKVTITSVIEKIRDEYKENLDEHSQDLLVTNVELLLSYIQRFYKRQFLTRKVVNTDLLSKFERLMKEYFNSDQVEIKGLPKVSYFAEKLNLSPNYLSDMFKKETGKNAQEQIHYYLIEKAKNLLLNSNSAVSEISYQLGFEYPQYFSRIFKKKTGLSPNQYKHQN